MMRRRQMGREQDIDVPVADSAYWQTKFSQHKPTEDKSSSVKGQKRRIVLIGKTGHGKSASGNTILGCTSLENRKFKTTTGLTSVTQRCEKHEADRFGKRLEVVDTPGLFDTNGNKVKTEIGRCVCLSQPGPHVFLLVFGLSSRYTPEERKAIENIEQMFGEMARRHTILLFTGIDNLEADGETLSGKIRQDQILSNLVVKFGNRYHGLNNRSNDDEQVRMLVDKIEDVVQSNEGHFYTNDMYKTASLELHKEIEEILRKKMPDILDKERNCSFAADTDKLWGEEVKAAVEKATGIVATTLRNKGSVTLLALLGGAGGAFLAVKYASVGATVAGPVGAAVGALSGAAVTIGYKILAKK